MTNRREIARIETAAAIRWCGSLLREVLANHGELLADEDRERLRDAVLMLPGLSSRLVHPGEMKEPTQ